MLHLMLLQKINNMKKYIYKYLYERKKLNVNKANHKKKALLSYIVNPFRKNDNQKHTNYKEAWNLAKVLDELGFNVDVINYNEYCDVEEYYLVIGFGKVFNVETILNNKINTKFIIYGTGFCSLDQRLKSIEKLTEYNTPQLIDSCRLESLVDPLEIKLCDMVLSLGNNYSSNTYYKFNKNVKNIRSFYNDIKIHIIEKNEKDFNKGVWFGGGGAVHKGLLNALEFVKKNSFHLHIFGKIEDSVLFFISKNYEKSLFTIHGFIDLNDINKQEIISSCGFYFNSSASEGGCPSALQILSHFHLIPILSNNCSIDIPNKIIYNNVTEASFQYNEIVKNGIFNYNENEYFIKNNYNKDNHYNDLKFEINEFFNIYIDH